MAEPHTPSDAAGSTAGLRDTPAETDAERSNLTTTDYQTWREAIEEGQTCD